MATQIKSNTLTAYDIIYLLFRSHRSKSITEGDFKTQLNAANQRVLLFHFHFDLV